MELNELKSYIKRAIELESNYQYGSGWQEN